MKYYLVVQNDVATNVIVADSIEDAQMVTNTECVETTLEPGSPSIGWVRFNGEFQPPLVSSKN